MLNSTAFYLLFIYKMNINIKSANIKNNELNNVEIGNNEMKNIKNKKMQMHNDVKKSFKYILGYCTCIILFIGISIYLYMLIIDHLEHEEHTKEEKIWIYGFLVIMIIGFILSYNIIYSDI